MNKENTQRGIYGKYLGNIYGIYKEYRGAGGGVGRAPPPPTRPSPPARAPHPHPPLYIPYIFHIYFFQTFPHIVLCVLLNLLSQQETSPHRKTS